MYKRRGRSSPVPGSDTTDLRISSSTTSNLLLIRLIRVVLWIGHCHLWMYDYLKWCLYHLNHKFLKLLKNTNDNRKIGETVNFSMLGKVCPWSAQQKIWRRDVKYNLFLQKYAQKFWITPLPAPGKYHEGVSNS